MAGSTGVHDTVVNQLLSKIDGVEQLNNILVIGMIMLSFLLWGLVEKCLLAAGQLTYHCWYWMCLDSSE